MRNILVAIFMLIGVASPLNAQQSTKVQEVGGVNLLPLIWPSWQTGPSGEATEIVSGSNINFQIVICANPTTDVSEVEILISVQSTVSYKIRPGACGSYAVAPGARVAIKAGDQASGRFNIYS